MLALHLCVTVLQQMVPLVSVGNGVTCICEPGEGHKPPNTDTPPTGLLIGAPEIVFEENFKNFLFASLKDTKSK